MRSPNHNMSRILPCLLAVTAFAQISPPSRKSASPTGATVEGVVTNSITGGLLARAHVMLHGSGSGTETRMEYGAVTDDNGNFSISTVQPDDYLVTAERPGFVTSGQGAVPPLQGLRIGSADKGTSLKLKLMPGGAFTGRVTDSDGKPVDSVLVSAILDDALQQSSTTDDEGHFRLGDLPPGRYRLLAFPVRLRRPPEIRSDGTTEVQYGRTYYPEARDRKGASRIELAAGAEIAGLDIKLLPIPILNVKGMVTGIPENVESITVQVRDQDTRVAGFSTEAKPAGPFTLWRLDPGKYALSAVCNLRGGGLLRSPPIEIEAGAFGPGPVELPLVPPSDVEGQMEFDEPPPEPEPAAAQQGAAPSVRTDGAARRVYLTGLDPDTGNYGAPIGADGAFTLRRVQPGHYAIGLSWAPAFVRSTALGPKETEGSLLDLNGGTPQGTKLEVRVSSALAGVSGTVRDAQGTATRALVFLVPDDRYPALSPQSAAVKSGGAYTMDRILPGTYRIIAVDPGELRSLTVRRKLPEEYDEAAQTVEVGVRDKLTIDLWKFTLRK